MLLGIWVGMLQQESMVEKETWLKLFYLENLNLTNEAMLHKP